MSPPLVKFGDVVRLNTDRVGDPLGAGIERYVGLEHITPEDLHIHSWGLVAEGTTFTNAFKPGQVLFGKRRAYQRKVAVADFEGVCSGDIYVFESKNPDVLLPDLLPFICQTESFYQYAVGTSAGSLSPRTNWGQLANYEFPLPPLDEQRCNAELLWAVEEATENIKRTHDSTINLRLSLISEEFSRFSEFVKLKDVCEKIVDGPHYPPKFVDNGIPFILVSNLSSGYISWNVSKWISENDYAEIYKRINSSIGDVLYTVVGSYGVPIYIDWNIPFAFQRHIALLKPKKNVLDGHFLKYYLESSLGKQQAILYAVGLAQKTLTLGALQQFKFPIVSYEQQLQIVGKIREIDTASGLLENHISCIQAVKTSMLRNIF